MSDDDSRFELVQAAYQGWNLGFADAQSLAVQVERLGPERLDEDRRKWRQENPGEPWLWDNPYAPEYRRLKADRDSRNA